MLIFAAVLSKPLAVPMPVRPRSFSFHPQKIRYFSYSMLSYRKYPYDGFLAKLHEGEQVLTKQEAKQRSGSITIAKLADQIIVREDADIDKIAAALIQRIADAGENYAGA